LSGAAVVSAVPAVSALVVQGWHGADVPLALGISTMGLVFGPAIGAAVTLLSDRNEEQHALLDELARSRAEVVRLSREAGVAGERARLAREIHDTLAQGFTSIVAMVQVVESEFATDPPEARRHLALIGATARENLTEARAMLTELTPSALTTGSLVEALRREGRRLTEATGIAVDVASAEQLPRLDTATEVVLLRAAQEAFANVRKHADADTVAVRLVRTASGLKMTVTDNGVGFNPDAVTTGLGLHGMRSRATQIGATMTLASRAGAGTTIELEVPA
jgi:signal transduction histidine kinase